MINYIRGLLKSGVSLKIPFHDNFDVDNNKSINNML